VPVTMSGLAHVTARINGASADLILDTGAERSLLGVEAAKRLHVTEAYDFSRSVSGIGKVFQTGDARLRSMTLGGVTLEDARMLVGPLGLGGPDGLLGADLLGDFDLDIDLPRRELTLYDRVECAGLRPPWPGGYATIETTRSLDRHPLFPVQVDGRSLSATLDTGAQRTVIAASRAGVSPAELAGDPRLATRGAGGEVLPAFLHQFRELRIGGDPFRSAVLVVPGLRLPRDADVIVGLDYLMWRRVWLSYGSRRIFVAAVGS
jgi:predicted aspartyl protease